MSRRRQRSYYASVIHRVYASNSAHPGTNERVGLKSSRSRQSKENPREEMRDYGRKNRTTVSRSRSRAARCSCARACEIWKTEQGSGTKTAGRNCHTRGRKIVELGKQSRKRRRTTRQKKGKFRKIKKGEPTPAAARGSQEMERRLLHKSGKPHTVRALRSHLPLVRQV